MSDIDEFSLRRFDKITDPAAHGPTAALDAAKKWIMEQPEEDRTQHVIVFCGRTTPDGGSAHRFFQAGSYPHHAQLGLIMAGLGMLQGIE